MERAAFGHSPEGWHRHMVKKYGKKKATALWRAERMMSKGLRDTIDYVADHPEHSSEFKSDLLRPYIDEILDLAARKDSEILSAGEEVVKV